MSVATLKSEVKSTSDSLNLINNYHQDEIGSADGLKETNEETTTHTSFEPGALSHPSAQHDASPEPVSRSHDPKSQSHDPAHDPKSQSHDQCVKTLSTDETSTTSQNDLTQTPSQQSTVNAYQAVSSTEVKDSSSDDKIPSESHSSSSDLPENVTLRGKSPTDDSEANVPKMHALSRDTSDSEPEVPCNHVPGIYTSGEEGSPGTLQNVDRHPLEQSTTPSPTLLDAPMSILFGGVTYMGCSSVDAPISEVEANRKMYTLKTQAASSKPMTVILSIPISNDGNVILKDTESEQPLLIFAVKMILFCARGNADELLDCFCLNIKHTTGVYRCHAFRCEIPEACQRVFQAIGKAFKTKPLDRNLPPLMDDKLICNFEVRVDITEEDGKGGFSPVSFEKDCFKLKQNLKKKITLTVSQQNEDRPLVVERCFGLLISPFKVMKNSEMNLLDNMNCSTPNNHTFTVMGIWDTSVPFLAALNQETPKALRHQYVTIAADLVLESVTEPVRFKREVKVNISTKSFLDRFQSQIQMPKKKFVESINSKTISITFQKSDEISSGQVSMYSIADMVYEVDSDPHRDSTTAHHSLNPSLEQAAKKKPTNSGNTKETKEEENDDSNEETHSDDGDLILSGWGDIDDTREDLLGDWGELLETWDGKEQSRPNKLVKLCRKGIPRHLRCQVWQMLSGASYDPQLQESYRLLISKESPAENVIIWDIKRTYVGHGYFQESGGRDALYKICKAYSVYDEEVGYCQGFSFMAATLLLQKMPEEEAFSVMVKILYNYKHRNLFKANFQNLHLMFYQLDKLLEEYLPSIFTHFKENRIETHMFASQWFLTLYTAKFPLSLVFRILDIYLCERISVIFRVALALLKIASKDLLGLDFEGILTYFRVHLPKKFQTEDEAKHLFHCIFTYNKVTEKKLAKLEKDYQLYVERQAQLEDPVMRLERENKQLRDSVMRLEGENDNLAEELVGSKITLREEMDKLEERIDTLSKEARAHNTSSELAQQMNGELKEEVQQAKEEYQKVMVQLMEEKMQHDGSSLEFKRVLKQLDESHQKEIEEMKQELLEVKASQGKISESSDEVSSDYRASLSSEQRLRDLELELARTKLALVESQCKNTELDRKLQQLSSSNLKHTHSLRKK